MLIKKQVLVALAAAFVVLTASAPAGAARLSSRDASLLRVVNITRAAYHLAPLGVDPTLQRAARAHSLEMIHSGAFSHGDFRNRMVGFGARGPAIGENLAWGVGSMAAARTIVDEWLASPEHRANLLRPGFRRIGIGSVNGSFAGHGGALVVTADFAGS